MEKDEEVQSQITSLHDELSQKNDDIISIGNTSLSTMNQDKSLSNLHIDKDYLSSKNLLASPLPPQISGKQSKENTSRSRTKYSNVSRSVRGEGSSVNNILLVDDYGHSFQRPTQVKLKYNTANKSLLHPKKKSMA